MSNKKLSESYRRLYCAVLILAIKDALNGDANAMDWLMDTGVQWIKALGIVTSDAKLAAWFASPSVRAMKIEEVAERTGISTRMINRDIGLRFLTAAYGCVGKGKRRNRHWITEDCIPPWLHERELNIMHRGE